MLTTVLALLAPLAAPQSSWDLEGLGPFTPPDWRNLRIAEGDVAASGQLYMCGRRPSSMNISRGFVTLIDDANGQVIWRTVLPSPATAVIPSAVVASADGGSTTIALVRNTGVTVPRCMAFRLDANGGFLWERQIRGGQPGSTVIAHRAKGDGNGGVLIAGFQSTPGLHPNRATIFRLDAAGQELPPIAPFGNAYPELYDITPTSDGGYLVALGTVSGNHAAKLDSSFTPVWFTTVNAPVGPPGQRAFLRTIVEGEQGGVYALLYDGPVLSPCQLVRFDEATGAIQWIIDPHAEVMGLSGPARGASQRLVPRPGGGVLLAGIAEFQVPGFNFRQEVSFVGEVLPDGTAEALWQYGSPDPLQQLGLLLDGNRAYTYGFAELETPGIPPGTTRPVVLRFDIKDEIGTPYCMPSQPNSTGASGSIRATGSTLASANDVTLTATALPSLTTAMFVSGSQEGTIPLLGGSGGVLCVSGVIGRFQDSVGTTAANGTIRLRIDTASIPTALGPIAATSGLTYRFQCWHRDTSTSGSNTSSAVAVTFD